MGQQRHITDPDEREAILGLWAIPGIGTVTLRDLETAIGGNLAGLVDAPIREWIALAPIDALPKEYLKEAATLRSLAERIREMALATRTTLAFPGEPGYPEKLLDIPDPPSVVFYRGEVGVERRRIAMVGSRDASPEANDFAKDLAAAVARVGVGVVSGGAKGIDTSAHEGTLAVGGETWAWVACSLDQMDAKQRYLERKILDAGGRVLTEYPPNTRSKKDFFPRRNRLISGSADAVVVVRADLDSGSMHTVDHAEKQGRPLLMVPGDPFLGRNTGCNQWLHDGKAKMCLSPADVFAVLELNPVRVGEPVAPGRRVEDLGLSEKARATLNALTRQRQLFEEILGETGLSPSEQVSALTELELSGLAVQHPGKVYERV